MGGFQVNFWALPEDEKLVYAMEVWEGLVDLHTGRDDAAQGVTDAFNRHGYAAMREIAVAWVAPCAEAWITRDEHSFDSPFDWEFVPAFLKECVDWNAPNKPTLRPDWNELAHKFTDQRSAALESAS